VKNECTSRKPILCAICVPKIITFGRHLTNLFVTKIILHSFFFRHGVDVQVAH